MLKLFKVRQRRILGIDISATSVKILEISSSADTHCIEGYGAVSLPETAMEGNVIKDPEAVANAIRSVLLKERLKCKQAAIAVPDSATISKVLQINEGLKPHEMEEVVIMEADKYIPYPIDEINFDFEVLGPAAKNTSMLDVLIVASRGENVSNRIEVIAQAGLEGKIVDVESYAVERAVQLLAPDLPAQGVNKLVVVVDIGAEYTHFFFLYDMKIIFVREEEFGGKKLIESMMQRYDMKAEEVDVALDKADLPEDYEVEILKPFQEQMLLEIKRGLQFFFSTSNHTYVDHIVLAGGVAKQPDIASIVQEGINIPTSIANPIAHMECVNINKDRIIVDAPKLLVACGLALRASR